MDATNYIDGFRNPGAARELKRQIDELASALAHEGRSAAIMEVCGTHTMSIARYGIRELLPGNIRLLSGPGCPVCVTPPGYIDAAVQLAQRGVTLVTFGDMINVPGSGTTLAKCRAEGCCIEVAYGPATALRMARAHPDREVVFLAIGFETTICPTISMLDQAMVQGVQNLSLLTAFKAVPPALLALLQDVDVAVDAFLCPAHVSAIIGSDAYKPFTGEGGVPCVVAGFEPLDILLGIHGILRQWVSERAEVENQYERVVRPGGNERARQLMAKHLRPVETRWRGIGVIPSSGFVLDGMAAEYDAATRFDLEVQPGTEPDGCCCGDVIKGKIEPPDCPLFGGACTPDRAVGPCMVSAEGSCAAFFKYVNHRR